jgi:hypothetical protein
LVLAAVLAVEVALLMTADQELPTKDLTEGWEFGLLIITLTPVVVAVLVVMVLMQLLP